LPLGSRSLSRPPTSRFVVAVHLYLIYSWTPGRPQPHATVPSWPCASASRGVRYRDGAGGAIPAELPARPPAGRRLGERTYGLTRWLARHPSGE